MSQTHWWMATAAVPAATSPIVKIPVPLSVTTPVSYVPRETSVTVIYKNSGS